MQKKAAVETDKIRTAIETSAVVGADETGIKVNGEQHWVWVFQADMLSYIFVDKGRGKAVIDKHFPAGLPQSTVVSDRLSAYFNIETKDNRVCLAHLLRNLLYLSQTTPQSDWAEKMMDSLRRAIHLKHEHPRPRGRLHRGHSDDKRTRRAAQRTYLAQDRRPRTAEITDKLHP